MEHARKETPGRPLTRPPDERLISGEVVPILRWAGSKRKTLGSLTSFWNDGFDRYIEPFVGSACLFLRLKPSSAILADLNSALIDTYEAIRDNPVAVAEAVYAFPRDAATYYSIRRSYNASKPTIERAAQFVYLNRNCFNGIFRTNLNGDFNVPFGRDQGHYPRLCDFQRTSALLKRVELLRGDFEATLAHVRKGDFVYLDPPFAATGVRTFVEYGKRSFTEDDLDRLTRQLDHIHACGGAFLVSYADCPRARKIGGNWNSQTIDVRRQIAGFASKRKMSSELLITNLDIPEEQ